MTFPVIVTRTAPGLHKTVEKLKALGVKPIAAPMLTVHFVDTATIPADPAITVFTSVNGVKSYARLTERRDTRVYCIGVATQGAAEEMGWTVLASSHGGAGELIELIKKHVDPSDGLIVHPTNARTASGITEMLQRSGYSAQMVHCYCAKRKGKLPRKATDALQSDDCVVMFYSSEAMWAFLDIDGAWNNRNLKIIGLSENVVSVLRRSGFTNLWVAEKPTDDAMVKVLTLPEFSG